MLRKEQYEPVPDTAVLMQGPGHGRGFEGPGQSTWGQGGEGGLDDSAAPRAPAKHRPPLPEVSGTSFKSIQHSKGLGWGLADPSDSSNPFYVVLLSHVLKGLSLPSAGQILGPPPKSLRHVKLVSWPRVCL